MDIKWILLPTFFLACAALGCSTICSNGDQCGKNECCVTLSMKASRRGTCRKLSRESESCSMPGDIIKKYGEKYVIACPCQEGLICTARKATRELVYGPMAVLVLKCRKQSSTDGKPAEKPVPGDDGVEIIYEEMDGGTVMEEEVISKAITHTQGQQKE